MNVYGIPYKRLREVLTSCNLPAYRADQIYAAVFKERKSLQQCSTFGKELKTTLGTMFSEDLGTIQDRKVSVDGTTKWLLQLPRDGATVETVYIPEEEGPRYRSPWRPTSSAPAKPRATLCVSSQVGCSLACTFCHTGTQKLQRNLQAEDIVAQYLLAADDMASRPTAPRISNIVFMGQGEPGYNWTNVKKAITVLMEPKGLALSGRRITISTSGVAPIIPKIAEELPGVKLAISLHAPNDSLRTEIMNINKTYPLDVLMSACRQYITTRLKASNDSAEDDEPGDVDIYDAAKGMDSHNSNKRVRITFEYVMLNGVNDSPAHAKELCALFNRYLPKECVHMNLIPFNPWPGSTFTGSPEKRILDFQDIMYRRGIQTNVRRSRGVDILGACGQLKSSLENKARSQAVSQEPLR